MFISDRIPLGSKRTFTDEGYLVVPGRIGRTGIQIYLAGELGLTDVDPNKEIRVYRSPDEVFSQVSLNSFSNKPVTNDHPPVLVNSENYKKYAVGISAKDVDVFGDYIETELIIMDKSAIEAIQAGKSELSNGYVMNLDMTPGISDDGQEFDAQQKDIVGNHIAIVEKGRAGFNCRVADKSPKIEKSKMATITIDGVDYEAPEQTAQAMSKVQKRLVDAEESVIEKDEELEKKDEELKKKEEDSKEELDEMEKAKDEAEAKIPTGDSLDKLVIARQELLTSATRIMPTLDSVGKTDSQIKSEVVLFKSPTLNITDSSDDYIQARFDALLDVAPASTLDSALIESLNTNDSQGEVTDNVVKTARDNFAKKSKNLWKGGK